MIMKRLDYLQARISDWISKKFMPPDKCEVRQAGINECQMLVFANETVGRQILWNGCYEKEETRFLSRFLKSSDTCLDVGANVGYFSLLMASKATLGQVHSFEPIPICYHLLCCSTYLNRFTNVVANNCAVGELDGESTFHIAKDSAFSFLGLAPGEGQGRSLTVPVVSIDTYMYRRQIERVDFLKIDVEGSEGQVIRGATSLLASPTRRPRLIIVEVGVDHLGKVLPASRDLIDLVKGYGYRAEILRDGRLMTVNVENFGNNYNVFFRAV